MKKALKNMSIEKVVKVAVALVAALIALYAFVYVPSQELMLQQKAFERAEARVHNSCILIAQQATQQALANPPEDVTEEPSEEQVNEFLNTQYAQCIASEGYNPAELAGKYLVEGPAAPAQAPVAQ